MFTVQQLSDVPYIGAPCASWYIIYHQKTKAVYLDGEKVSSKVAYDVIKDIIEQLRKDPKKGHHYDISKYGDITRIGISGHGIGILKSDIPIL